MAEQEQKTQKSYPFFAYTECEFFPCHKGLEPENFNCLFCYCPLYALGPDCGGDFVYSSKGVKVCTNCNKPHVRDLGTIMVKEKFPLIKEMAKRPQGEGQQQ